MEAKELRFGNLIDYEATTHIVSGISESIIESYWLKDKGRTDLYQCSIDEIKPIPLTEEWISKFNEHLEQSGFITKRTLLGRLMVYIGFSYITTLEFVHEYQNFYYITVGNELTLKE